VPSILIACPVLAVGVACLDRKLFAPDPVRYLAVVTVAYAALVAVLQYGQGGGVEWGARYLAIVLPVAIPIALLSLARALDRTDRELRQRAVALLVAGSLAVGALSLSTIHTFHDHTRVFIANLSAAVGEAPGPDLGDGDRRPIVVSAWFVVGRISTPTGPPVRGLSVIGVPLRPVVQRLHDAGVQTFVLVLDDQAKRADLDGLYRVVSSREDGVNPPVLVVQAT
jgi:hypothetical protein